MKFGYRFSNLLGTVYRHGNLNYSPDGNSVISPVGNRVTVFDLKNNKSETLPFAAQRNIVCVGQSPDGHLAILVDEEGAALLVSLISKSVLHHFHFHARVHSVSFSPDGRRFVVSKDNVVLMYHAPGKTREFNAFVLDKSYFGPYDETTCIDWTDDSKCFAVGSKDSSTWVFGAERWANLIYYSLGGHKDAIVACFFEGKSLDIYTLSQDATLCVWECDTETQDLQPQLPKSSKKLDSDQSEEFGAQNREVIHGKRESEQERIGKVKYTRVGKYFFNKEKDFNDLTAAAYHKITHLLVTGFASGIFHLHELPEFNLIHSLSISEQRIESISVNVSGDWIAFGCPGLGQLLVWEWQSESYVLKQQGHFNNMVTLSYSPDAQYVVTGGDDGKVKVWNMSSGFCIVTFTEHTGGVTAVTFNSTGFVVLSASLDGTVRAFDLHRYRNFRTFTSLRPVQFTCLALDTSGEIVCAGSHDSFEVFVWSMQTGRLLDVLAGHEGPISSLSFSPSHTLLASASWDKTVKLWDMFDSWKTKETLVLNSDVLDVAFRPDGKELAVVTLDGQITFWDHQNAEQIGSIEGRHDLQMGRKELDKITAKQAAKGRSFSTLCYSADGQSVLAGGHSKFVCIYNVKEQLLVKRFEISCNLSLDAMEEFLDRRKMTEFGSLALIDDGAGDEHGVAISLPGVKKGDMSSRHFKPEIRVTCLRFSPTGRSWAATSTEGLLIFSLDGSVVFDPFDLDEEVNPSIIRRVLRKKEFTAAIMMAFRLNEDKLTLEVLESVPHADIDLVCSTLPLLYVEKLLQFVASALETSRHLEFFLTWAQRLLTLHGQKLKARSVVLLPMIQSLQRSIQHHFDTVSKLCDWNRYNIRYTLALSKQRGMKRPAEIAESEGESNGYEEATEQLMDASD
ncbi:PWP2 small subunit processome component isoform X1 [Carcharodon carcharias]|uniref:PWP2 small subunit processome component isoform X1 n=2 Tax=Carcharodon carcharias TaxID=13397 RepID=UPI001B7D9FF5|nr:PWP2 small subunit processome component isoform X1 [Carcharodon carcharias]